MEYAVMRRQNGSEQTAFEGVAALRALDAAQCCTECGATKPDGAQGWAAGFTRTQRTRTAGITETVAGDVRCVLARRGHIEARTHVAG